MDFLESDFGLRVVLWLQSVPFLPGLLLPFHYLGGEVFYLALLPAIYWCGSADLGRRLMPLFLLSAWTNAFLKESWQRPRPFHVSSAVNPLVGASGFGMPSGHSQNAVLVGGLLALAARRPAATLALAAYALLTGLSRLVHGVHYPQDVVAGWMVGAVFVAAYARFEPAVVPRLRRLGVVQQLGLVSLLTLASFTLLPGWVRPAASHDLAVPCAALGTFFGASSGFVLEARYLRFSAGGPRAWKRLLLGLLVLVPLHVGLRPLPPFARYTIVGLFVSFGAPWIFLKTGQ